MDELRLTGNALRGSRPVLSFDASFDDESMPHLQMIKEIFIQVFGTPRGHPKSQPFHDKVMGFYILDGKIWVRHYQIHDRATDPKAIRRMLAAGEEPTTLVEIGPRFVLDIVKVFDGGFSGRTLYSNPSFVSPNAVRHELMLMRGSVYEERKVSEMGRMEREAEHVLPPDPLSDLFRDPTKPQPKHEDDDDEESLEEDEEEEEEEEEEDDDDEEEESD